jgi:hypothetical protein
LFECLYHLETVFVNCTFVCLHFLYALLQLRNNIVTFLELITELLLFALTLSELLV